MSSKTKTVLTLAPGVMELTHAVRDGEVRALRELDDQAWETAWDEGLRPYDEVLGGMVQELDLPRGTPLTVIAASPHGTAEVLEFQTKGRDALSAARLRIAEGIGVKSEDVVASGRIIDGPDETSTRVLACADDNVSIEAVSAMVTRVGLRFVGMTPMRAVSLATLQDTLANIDTDRAFVVCSIDRHSMALAAGEHGRMGLMRSVSIGTQSLAVAYQRAMAETDPNVDASFARVLSLLDRYGIPERRQKIEGDVHLRGDQVLPGMQPVLQRLIVEIRQTLRFGISGRASTNADVYLTGEGSRVPGIGDVISNALELPTSLLETPGGTAMPMASRWLNASRKDLELGCRSTEYARRSRLISRALVASSLLAGGLICAEYASLSLSLNQQETKLAEQHAKLVEMRNANALAEQANAMIEQERALRTLGEEVVRERVHWDYVLKQIAVATPEGVVLEELRASGQGGGPSLRVTGTVEPGVEGGVSGLIEAFTLLPSIESVMLASARLEDEGEDQVTRFTVDIGIRAIPDELGWAWVTRRHDEEMLP